MILAETHKLISRPIKSAAPATAAGDLQNVARQQHEFSARTPQQQHGKKFVVASHQRNGVKGFGVGGVLCPIDGPNSGFGCF